MSDSISMDRQATHRYSDQRFVAHIAAELAAWLTRPAHNEMECLYGLVVLCGVTCVAHLNQLLLQRRVTQRQRDAAVAWEREHNTTLRVRQQRQQRTERIIARTRQCYADRHTNTRQKDKHTARITYRVCCSVLHSSTHATQQRSAPTCTTAAVGTPAPNTQLAGSLTAHDEAKPQLLQQHTQHDVDQAAAGTVGHHQHNRRALQTDTTRGYSVKV